MTQAAETAEATAAAICHVPDSASDKAAYHQQDCASVGILSAAAWLHCGPLYKLPGVPMVIHSNQLTLTPDLPLPLFPTSIHIHSQTSNKAVSLHDQVHTSFSGW